MLEPSHALTQGAFSPSLAQLALYAVAAWVLWTAAWAVYNLYFHPLAKFPGPRLAAATEWWQVWLEVVTEQSLSLKLWELHAIYGVYTTHAQSHPC